MRTLYKLCKLDNAHDDNNEKKFLYLLKSKPISSQYGSKVHNYFYEPIEVTGSEAVMGTAPEIKLRVQ